MGRQLNLAQLNGDLSVANIFPLFQLVIKTCNEGISFQEKEGASLKKVMGHQLENPNPPSLSLVPKPPSFTEIGSVDKSCRSAPGCHRFPVASQPSFSLCLSDSGQVAWDLPLTFLPMPTYLSSTPSQVSTIKVSGFQNGVGQVVSPTILPASTPSFPAPDSQNGRSLSQVPAQSTAQAQVAAPHPSHESNPLSVTASGPAP